MNPTVLAALMALFPTQTEAEVKKQADSAGDPSMLMELIKMLLGAEQRATMAESKLAAYGDGDMAGMAGKVKDDRSPASPVVVDGPEAPDAGPEGSGVHRLYSAELIAAPAANTDACIAKALGRLAVAWRRTKRSVSSR